MNLNNSIPLFVDLDGTIIKEDIGQMAVKKKVFSNFLCIFNIIFKFIFFGKPSVKLYVSRNYKLNFDEIHFNSACLDFISKARETNRKIFLISGSQELVVKKIANKLNIFDDVYGTRENYNMVSYNKVKFIHDTLGFNKFDYIGNSHQDLKVWEYSENIIYTNVSKSLLSKINVMNKNKICIKSIFN